LHVWTLAKQVDEFLEFTGNARNQLDNLLPAGEPYRGQRISVMRGNGDKARLTVEVLPAAQVNGRLPACKDPYSTLCKIWGLPHLLDRKPNTAELDSGSEVA